MNRQPPVQVLKQRVHKGPSPLELEQEKMEQEYKEHCIRELRNYIRTVLTYFKRDKKYKQFVDPVDEEEVKDYYEIIKNPICLNQMHDKVDNGEYQTVEAFMDDIDLLVANAKEYNPNNTAGRNIIRTAVQLRDEILSYQHRFSNKLGYDLFGECLKYYEQSKQENKSENEAKENDDDDNDDNNDKGSKKIKNKKKTNDMEEVEEEEVNNNEENDNEEGEGEGKVVSKLRHAYDRTQEILPPPSQSESVAMSQEEVASIDEVRKLGKKLFDKLILSKQSVNNHYQIYLRIKGIITESKLKCDMNFLLQEFEHLLEIVSN